MPTHIWMDAVTAAVMPFGVMAEWLREPTQRARMNRFHSAGEPVWMAAESMIEFWRGEQRAAREDADGFGVMRAAIRGGER